MTLAVDCECKALNQTNKQGKENITTFVFYIVKILQDYFKTINSKRVCETQTDQKYPIQWDPGPGFRMQEKSLL